MTMTRLKQVLATVGVAAMGAFALSGCGSPADAAGSGDTDQLTQTRGDFFALLDTVHGDSDDREAGEFTAHTLQQQAIAACMARYDFDYQPIPFQRTGPTRSFIASDTAFSPIAEFGIGAGKAIEAQNPPVYDPAYEALPEKEKIRWGKTITAECGQAGGDDPDTTTVEPDVRAQWERPAHFDEVNTALMDMLETARQDPGLQKAYGEYRSCMEGGGFNATVSGVGDESGEPLAAVLGQVTAAYNAVPAGEWATMVDTPQWETASRLEATASAQDAVCRQPVQDAALTLITDELAAFQTQHAETIGLVAGEWNTIREKASSLR
ncbi:hypothetical protein AB0I28_32390 [Phytomonospora sp. NPDC050363]|uniref:hypothetical protein n=1 Tax=Phytomonospora sp. NPDC050363 TaxID=3155642 RepID=UPI00340EA354